MPSRRTTGSRNLTSEEVATAATQCAPTGEPTRDFAERTDQTRETWSCAGRVGAKAEHLAAGDESQSNPFFAVMSLAVGTVDALAPYQDAYCACDQMEYRIKARQLMLFADRTCAAAMRANQRQPYFSSIAYLLLHALRSVGLMGTALAHAQCQRPRLGLLKIGAQIRITVRHVWRTPPQAIPTQR